MRMTNPRRRTCKFEFTFNFPFHSKIVNNNAPATATPIRRLIIIIKMKGRSS